MANLHDTTELNIYSKNDRDTINAIKRLGFPPNKTRALIVQCLIDNHPELSEELKKDLLKKYEKDM